MEITASTGEQATADAIARAEAFEAAVKAAADAKAKASGDKSVAAFNGALTKLGF